MSYSKLLTHKNQFEKLLGGGVGGGWEEEGCVCVCVCGGGGGGGVLNHLASMKSKR